MREYLISAVAQIEAAAHSLTPSQYRTARRLLDHTDSNGELHLDETYVLLLCNTQSRNTMRAHLIALVGANIISYAINHQVHVGFLAWPAIAQRSNSRAGRSNSRAGRSNLIATGSSETDEPITRSPSDQIRAQGDQIRAQGDQIRAQGDHLGGIKGGLVGWDLDYPSLEVIDQPTNLPAPVLAQPEPEPPVRVAVATGRTAPVPAVDPTPEPEPPVRVAVATGRATDPQSAIRNPQSTVPGPVEQALGLALLVAAGVIPRNARRLAAEQPFERVQRAVAHWYAGKGDRFEETPGIVVSWLDDWDNAGVPLALSPAFQRSEMYRNHRTRAQIAADAAMCIPDPPPVCRLSAVPPARAAYSAAGGTQAGAATQPLSALWADIVAAYPESVQLYLRQAHLVSVADRQAHLMAPAPAIPWLRTQLSRRLVRDFELRGKPVTAVTFAAPGEEEVGHAGSTA